jgi:hypothetical protein
MKFSCSGVDTTHSYPSILITCLAPFYPVRLKNSRGTLSTIVILPVMNESIAFIPPKTRTGVASLDSEMSESDILYYISTRGYIYCFYICNAMFYSFLESMSIIDWSSCILDVCIEDLLTRTAVYWARSRNVLIGTPKIE